MNRFDIVGLTLAEISLVLLFSFIAVFLPAYGHVRKELDSIKAATMLTGDIQKQLADAKSENVRLQQEIENSRRNLRSVATPSCFEINKTTGWLFTAIIRGADRYEVLGQEFTFASLLAKYSSNLTQGKQDGCRQRVRIYFGNGVSVADYDYALRRLEEYFYDSKLGLEQNSVKN